MPRRASPRAFPLSSTIDGDDYIYAALLIGATMRPQARSFSSYSPPPINFNKCAESGNSKFMGPVFLPPIYSTHAAKAISASHTVSYHATMQFTRPHGLIGEAGTIFHF